MSRSKSDAALLTGERTSATSSAATIPTPAPVRPSIRRPRPGGFVLGYRPALDGVRGISILLVMMFHARLPFAAGGFIGVDVFFVLSGFLITALLVQEHDRTGRIDLKRFWARRALRLLPALGALLGTCALYALALGGPWTARLFKGIAVTALYLSNWVSAFELGSLHPLAHTWSLAIEEQFYLLWPPLLLVLLARGAKTRRLATALALGVLASWAARLLIFEGPGSIARLYYGLDARADSLLVGCLLGVLVARGTLRSGSPSRGHVTLAAVATLAVAVFVLEKDGALVYLGAQTFVALAAAVLVLAALAPRPTRLRRALEMRPLVAVGRLSYGLYLWHYAIFWIIDFHRWLPAAATRIPIAFAASFVLAGLSYRWVERPFLRWKGHLGGRSPVQPV